MIKLTAVENVPKRKRNYSSLQSLITEFANGTCDIVRIDHSGHYISAEVCASTWYIAIKRSGIPGIKVYRRNDEVYLKREDRGLRGEGE